MRCKQMFDKQHDSLLNQQSFCARAVSSNSNWLPCKIQQQASERAILRAFRRCFLINDDCFEGIAFTDR